MDWTWRLYLYFLIITTGASPEAKPLFPLDDCQKDDIDLLLIADASGDPSTLHNRIERQTTFFKELLDLFLAPEEAVLTRLKVAVASVTISGPRTLILFQSNKSREELEMEVSNVNYVFSEFRAARPSLRAVVEFAEEEFIYMTDERRENAIPVVVMVLSDYESKTAGQLQLYLSEHEQFSEVRIFVAMVGYENAALNQNLTNNVIPVASFTDLLNNQRFAMAICKKCHPSWFKLEHNDSQSGVSCYKALNFSDTISWIEASNECRNYGSQLVSIETEEEFMFLSPRIQQILEEAFLVRKEGLAPGGESAACDAALHIFIGLTRNVTNHEQRFRWLNHRPLLLHHWMTVDHFLSPDGGFVQNCVVWAHFLPSASNYSYWLDIGCGMPYRYLALCEVFQHVPHNTYQTAITIEAANNASYEQALRKGEFWDLQGKIISLPASLENPFNVKMLLERKILINLFSCENDKSGNNIIPYSSVCDFVRNCKNGNDELICQYRRCDPATEFTCLSKQCVPLESRCDLYKDCLDGSDEIECTECKGYSCCDGTCLPKHWFGDSEIDCPTCENKSPCSPSTRIDHDERVVGNNGCIFICNRAECIFPGDLNDSYVQCKGPEGPLDAIIGKLETINVCSFVSGNSLEFYWSPRCVYIKDRYGSVLGCRNMSHLLDCTNFQCPEGYVKCPQSYCIALHSLYDGTMDCPFGEDEQYVDDHNCTGNFDCWNSEVCVHPDLVCDGHPHCPSGDDELACNTSCSDGFLCIAGMVTVADYDKSKPLHSLVFIDKRTRYLDLSGVDLSAPLLKEDRGHFINLIYLRLSGCQLDSVTGSFALEVQGLETVYWMDLSHNFIKEITRDSMFTYMTNLHELDLSYNRLLTSIHCCGLSPANGASLLETLDLSNTGLKYIDKDALQHLLHLRNLNLSHTKLNNLDNYVFPENLMLEILDMRESPVQNIHQDSLTGLTVVNDLYTDNYKLCCPQFRGPGIPAYACHAPQDAISSCSDLIGNNGQRVLLWIIGSIAILGNVVVLTFRLIFHRDSLTAGINVFVANLGFSDLIMGVYLLIIAIVDMYYRGAYVRKEEAWRQSVLCKAVGFLSTLSSETSTFFVFLITFDRYLTIKFPFGQHRFSKCSTTVSVVLSWATGFLLALIPVLPIFNNWNIYSSNGMCLGLPLSSKRLAGWEYSMAVFIILNFVMFLFIGFGQFFIYRAMSENRMTKYVAQSSARRAQDIAVAKQLSFVALTDFLCWFPIGLMGILAMGGREIGIEAYSWSAVLILPVNSAINPLLYTIPLLSHKWKQFRNKKTKTVVIS